MTDPPAAGLPPDAEPFAAGRDADVYALDDAWVLRRYRNGHPVRDEADFMRHVAQYDYPVPAVGEVSGPDMVIQRLDGPTLGDAAIAGRMVPSSTAPNTAAARPSSACLVAL